MVRTFDGTPELLGVFEGYPKNDIVRFLSSIGAAGWDKKRWAKASDSIYYAYTRAVKRGMPRWEPSNATAANKTIEEVVKTAGLPRNVVYSYIMGLYTMVKMGKLDPKFWDPKTGDKLKKFNTKRVTDAIAEAMKPAGAVADPMKKHLTRIMIPILLAAGVTAIGAVAAKTYVNKKVI